MDSGRKGVGVMAISIIGQIDEAERELAMRQSVYPRRVSAGKMRQGESEMLMQRQEAIIATLKWCRDNEADIRAFVTARKAGAA